MKITEAIADRLDLPADAALNMSKIVITGKREVFVENYKGISEFTDEAVRLGTSGGMIRISGKNIEIKAIGADEITLCGRIRSVELN